MRTIFSFIAILILFSCESEGELTREKIGSMVVSSEAILLSTGTFEAEPGNTVTGSARIYKEGDLYKLSLKDFSISSGPDLKVYLSKTNRPDSFVNLGSLGTGNSQTYTIPAGVNLTVYPYVLIHCQQFNHLFATAALKSNLL
ncbi:DM13 domain-containing protein [Flavobacterium lipolyticum]|uniref:DM13 domain-containing protein n=1 Tax=Flavobacterium lipolyticum TaxID=2893754 RepID=A0ABS8M5S7_9FLAO|nr:DM13 domain-containing protein [Flavobacterium sp. F-126]MCC9020155.1 DM13 domain-containing protein [Flavobacterium sp. F-126]